MKLSKHKEYYPFLILMISLLIVHLFLPLNWSDDAVFLVKSSNLNLKQFLIGSARPLTDAMTYVLVRNNLIWRLLNPIVLTVLSITLSYLLSSINKLRQNIVICCTVFYPTLVLVDAGFIATTVNYLWPITCGLLCLIPIKQNYNNIKTSWAEALTLVPLLVYATNMQQMCVVLFIVLFVANCHNVIQHKFNIYILIQFLLTIVGLLYSYYLNMVGGNNRMLRETIRYFPEFSQLSVFEKLELGFSSTFYCLTMYVHFAWVAFIIFSFFITKEVFKRKEKILPKMISALPFVFTLCFGCISLLPPKYVPYLGVFIGNLQNYGVGKATYSFNIVADICFMLVCLCLIYSLAILLGQNNFYLALSVLFLGLISRLLMGFSPTVWASGFRTFAILIISFITTAVIVINARDDTGKDKKTLLGAFVS